MKKLSLAIVFTCLLNFVFGQTNYNKYSIGLNGGVTYPFTDVPNANIALSFALNADYYLHPFITIGLEIQSGKISGFGTGEDVRSYTNTYTAFAVNGKVRLGALVNYDKNRLLSALKGLYVGGGFGAINNDLTQINRKNTSTSTMPGYALMGLDKSTDIMIPVNAGYDWYFFNKWEIPKYILNFNIQYNTTIGDGLDGYSNPLKTSSTAPDAYFFVSLGIKYTFGTLGLSRKSIR